MTCREHVPFDLRERQEDVLVRQQRVLAATGLLDRAIDDALRCFRQSCSVRISRSSTCTAPSVRSAMSKMQASDTVRREPWLML